MTTLEIFIAEETNKFLFRPQTALMKVLRTAISRIFSQTLVRSFIAKMSRQNRKRT